LLTANIDKLGKNAKSKVCTQKNISTVCQVGGSKNPAYPYLQTVDATRRKKTTTKRNNNE